MSATTSGIRATLEAFRDEHDIPALGAGIVTRDGGLAVDVVGERVRGGADPIRPDDRWHIGSCGKSMTAALYARLVERGDAAWGASLADLFPDLAGTIDPAWAGITIDDLFVCQSGLPANMARSQMLAGLTDTRPLHEQRSEVVAGALARPPRKPGRFLYSNLGYLVAGGAIERITGGGFEEALRAHVLDPLGIVSAGFGPPSGPWGHAGRMLALGPLHLDLGPGAPADPADSASDNPSAMAAGGSPPPEPGGLGEVPSRVPHRGRGVPRAGHGRAAPDARLGSRVPDGVRLGGGERRGVHGTAGIQHVLGRHGADRSPAGAHGHGGLQRRSDPHAPANPGPGPSPSVRGRRASDQASAASSSIVRASARSFSVTPPSSWVDSVTTTRW